MNKGIILFIEGDTEEAFYKELLKNIRSLCGNNRFHLSKVIMKNLKGIGNYKKKVYRVFNDIISKNSKIVFKVFLCYDSDVFEFSKKPPVTWKEVDKILIENGAKKIIHIKAKKSIEDWFLNDLAGICSYLKLPYNTKSIGSDSIKRLEYLFRKANKVYIKGRANDFVESLNIKKIMKSVCCEIKPLCKELGVKCNGMPCKCDDS